MAYTKPAIIAQNASAGSYAAGCPAKDIIEQTSSDHGGKPRCSICEMGR